ncbi:MgtC/SapB family protein [Paracoccus luteus]|uniref:MgtC/SapB family protein n=1 Tax=Paracoccus luteus TaxID=2508543 RepID=UPI00106F5956|nr:MgtC/SapB family protein [Paracoccus luteus]
MDIWQDFTNPMNSVSMATAVLRLLTAILLGGVIGWEREVNSRAAGLRTHMLISLAAAAFAIVAMELTSFQAAPGTEIQTDPLRLIEAVTSGVAFLAAGSIVITGASVRGVTTGASMWLCGAIGLCCGVGDVKLAGLVTLMAIVVLWLIQRFVTPVAEQVRDQQADDHGTGGDRRGDRGG